MPGQVFKQRADRGGEVKKGSGLREEEGYVKALSDFYKKAYSYIITKFKQEHKEELGKLKKEALLRVPYKDQRERIAKLQLYLIKESLLEYNNWYKKLDWYVDVWFYIRDKQEKKADKQSKQVSEDDVNEFNRLNSAFGIKNPRLASVLIKAFTLAEAYLITKKEFEIPFPVGIKQKNGGYKYYEVKIPASELAKFLKINPSALERLHQKPLSQMQTQIKKEATTVPLISRGGIAKLDRARTLEQEMLFLRAIAPYNALIHSKEWRNLKKAQEKLDKKGRELFGKWRPRKTLEPGIYAEEYNSLEAFEKGIIKMRNYFYREYYEDLIQRKLDAYSEYLKVRKNYIEAQLKALEKAKEYELISLSDYEKISQDLKKEIKACENAIKGIEEYKKTVNKGDLKEIKGKWRSLKNVLSPILEEDVEADKKFGLERASGAVDYLTPAILLEATRKFLPEKYLSQVSSTIAKVDAVPFIGPLEVLDILINFASAATSGLTATAVASMPDWRVTTYAYILYIFGKEAKIPSFSKQAISFLLALGGFIPEVGHVFDAAGAVFDTEEKIKIDRRVEERFEEISKWSPVNITREIAMLKKELIKELELAKKD